MSFTVLTSRSNLIKPLILAGLFIAPTTYAESRHDLYDRIAKQELRISHLNKQIKMMQYHQKQEIDTLSEKINKLILLNDLDQKQINKNNSSRYVQQGKQQTNTNTQRVVVKPVTAQPAKTQQLVKKPNSNNTSRRTQTVVRTSSQQAQSGASKIASSNLTKQNILKQTTASNTIKATNRANAVNAINKRSVQKPSNVYIQDESTPESEKISVAPEVLFQQRFQQKFEPSTNASETYLNALQAFSINDTDKAVKEFKRYIHYHSDHEFISKAHYWLGMSYIKQKPANYSGARFEFMEVVNRYGNDRNNDKQAQALYRLAQLAKINNYTNEVRKYTNLLNKSYPNSKEAKLATQLLKELK